MGQIFFTSDTHFMHTNILKYCPGRKWASVEEMTEGLVTNWNARVTADDVVYHLGDFAMGGKQNVALRSRLNGKIILIKGNHDYKTGKTSPDSFLKDAGFAEVHNNLLLELDGLKLYLAHLPAHVIDPYEDRAAYEKFPAELLQPPPIGYDYFICGHVHDKWARKGNTINAGMDVSDYHPLLLSELLKRDTCLV